MNKTLLLLLSLPIILFISGCSGDSSTNTENNPPADSNPVVTVAVKDSFFDPKSVRIQPGTTVRWVRQANMTDHTTTSNTGVWDSGFVFRNQGDTFQRTFGPEDNNKTFLYHCTTHWTSDEMQGSILVGDDPPEPPPRY